MADGSSTKTWEPDFEAKASKYLENFTFDDAHSSELCLTVCQTLIAQIENKIKKTNNSAGALPRLTAQECLKSLNDNLSYVSVKNLLCCVQPGSNAQKKL